MRFNNSIDERNKNLLLDLEKNDIQIDFEVNHDFPSWAVQAKYRFEIVANDDNSSPESLAHELLHIKLNYLGFIPSNVITDIFNSSNCCFLTSTLTNMQNILAHLKMLPEFVNMGYSIEYFVKNSNDFLAQQLTPSITNLLFDYELQRKFKTKPSIGAVTQLIQILIEIKQYEIENSLLLEPKSDPAKLLEIIKICDQELVNAIYGEITNWVNSGIYYNYAFYFNLNLSLMNLGYPVENDWEEWQNNNADNSI